jgi:hypothetical protein
VRVKPAPSGTILDIENWKIGFNGRIVAASYQRIRGFCWMASG